MATSEAQKRANVAYNRRQDNIMIRPSKAEGAEIRAAAATAGKSVQAYIFDTLRAARALSDASDAKEEKRLTVRPRARNVKVYVNIQLKK